MAPALWRLLAAVAALSSVPVWAALDGSGVPPIPLCGYQTVCTAATCGSSLSGATATFDLGALRRGNGSSNATDWSIAKSEFAYSANVCGATLTRCMNVSNSIAWVEEAQPPFNCYVLGQTQPVEWKTVLFLEQLVGVQASYSDGSTQDCPLANPRAVTFRFICNASVEGSLIDASFGATPDTVCNYTLTFQTRHACPAVDFPGGQGGNGGGGGVALSGGSIFLVILLCGTFAYCAIGMFVNFQRGRHGSDIIPQREFWIALPGLVWAGCRYSASLLSCRVSTRPGGGLGTEPAASGSDGVGGGSGAIGGSYGTLHARDEN